MFRTIDFTIPGYLDVYGLRNNPKWDFHVERWTDIDWEIWFFSWRVCVALYPNRKRTAEMSRKAV